MLDAQNDGEEKKSLGDTETLAAAGVRDGATICVASLASDAEALSDDRKNAPRSGSALRDNVDRHGQNAYPARCL